MQQQQELQQKQPNRRAAIVTAIGWKLAWRLGWLALRSFLAATGWGVATHIAEAAFEATRSVVGDGAADAVELLASAFPEVRERVANLQTHSDRAV